MSSQHAIFGGSTASRWLSCAASTSLLNEMPRRPAGIAAEEGTAQHYCLDVLLRDASKMPQDFLGATINGIKITEFHVAQMEIALAAYEELSQDFEGNIKSEHRVTITDDVWGTADILLFNKDHLVVADFKFGTQGIIEAEMNDQALFYAVAARKTLRIDPKTVELVIIQPAMDPAIDRHTVPSSVLDAFEESVYAAVKAAKAPHPRPTEGEWCKWCDAKLICPAKLGALQTLTLPNHALKLDDVGALLLKIKGLEDWAAQAEERIHHELENGVPVKGWKLVNRRAVRQWKSEEKAIAAFRKARLKSSEYQITKLVSPSQAEKLIDKKIIATLADPVSSGTTIAPFEDKRPAVIPPMALGRALNKLL